MDPSLWSINQTKKKRGGGVALLLMEKSNVKMAPDIQWPYIGGESGERERQGKENRK